MFTDLEAYIICIVYSVHMYLLYLQVIQKSNTRATP